MTVHISRYVEKALKENEYTDAVQLPSGTTAQRPVAPQLKAGQTRWSTTLAAIEIYDGSVWLSMAQTLNPVFTGTGSVRLTVGTTAQRPASPAAGDFRLNSTLGKLEFYTGAAWETVTST